MSLKHGLLGLLNYGSMTGYELDKAFNASLGFFWQGQTSQIYRELSSMERAGWLTSERVIQEDKPNKKLYTITEDGKGALQEWLSDADGAIGDALCVRSAFLMRVFFAGELPPGQAISLLRSFRGECERALKGLDATAANITEYSEVVFDANKSKYWRIVALFGEGYYRAVLEWANKAIAILENKK
jgi:DNA-binding PadR family transcriptional regulator